MKDKFNQFIADHAIFDKEEKLLVAVSGGIDSMVLLHLLHSSGYRIAVVHCNFSLRGKESDDEEKFVRKQVKKLDLKLHVNQFNTAMYADKRGVSTQMAARALRYEWFHQLAAEFEYSKILVAHHFDDQIETVLLNLTRGTGIMGLTGMELLHGNIARPLLFATRAEISAYAAENKLTWKEDSSNNEDKYARNRIRHHVVPILKSINPGFYQTFAHSEQRIRNVQKIYAKEKADYLVLAAFDGGWKFELLPTTESAVNRALFREVLIDFGFTHQQIHDVLASVSANSGKQFLGKHCRLVKDRKAWLLTPIVHKEKEYLLEQGESLTTPIVLEVKTKNNKALKFTKDAAAAFLDFDKLEFPLKLRRWKKGDWFIPFGMKGKVKLSDYFVNHKFSLADKENIWILESGKDIVWLVGQRIDERYKVGQNTKKVYLARLKERV